MLISGETLRHTEFLAQSLCDTIIDMQLVCVLQCFKPFIQSKISRITICDSVIRSNQINSFGNVVYILHSLLYCGYNLFRAYACMTFHPEIPLHSQHFLILSDG